MQMRQPVVQTPPEFCRLRLMPSADQRQALEAIATAYAGLLAWLEREIPKDATVNMVELHNRWYERSRARSGLPARLVTLALKDLAHARKGRAVTGVPLDDKLFSIKSIHLVSLATLTGRIFVPFRILGYEPAALLEHGGAAARLVLQGSDIDLVVASAAPTHNGKESIMTATETVVARIGRVIAGMTHAAIGAAEQANPAAIIEQSIREIDGAADEVRAELGKVMAEKHRLGARSAELQREHDDLGSKLTAAVAAGRDDLASAGVGRQIDIEAQIAVLDRLLADADDQIARLEEALSAVRASRREAEERLAELKASAAAASADGGTAARPGAATDRAMGRVERAQAAAARVTGVPPAPGRTDAASIEELGKLARDRAIAERLKLLKGQG